MNIIIEGYEDVAYSFFNKQLSLITEAIAYDLLVREIMHKRGYLHAIIS